MAYFHLHRVNIHLAVPTEPKRLEWGSTPKTVGRISALDVRTRSSPADVAVPLTKANLRAQMRPKLPSAPNTQRYPRDSWALCAPSPAISDAATDTSPLRVMSSTPSQLPPFSPRGPRRVTSLCYYTPPYTKTHARCPSQRRGGGTIPHSPTIGERVRTSENFAPTRLLLSFIEKLFHEVDPHSFYLRRFFGWDGTFGRRSTLWVAGLLSTVPHSGGGLLRKNPLHNSCLSGKAWACARSVPGGRGRGLRETSMKGSDEGLSTHLRAYRARSESRSMSRGSSFVRSCCCFIVGCCVAYGSLWVSAERARRGGSDLLLWQKRASVAGPRQRCGELRSWDDLLYS